MYFELRCFFSGVQEEPKSKNQNLPVCNVIPNRNSVGMLNNGSVDYSANGATAQLSTSLPPLNVQSNGGVNSGVGGGSFRRSAEPSWRHSAAPRQQQQSATTTTTHEFFEYENQQPPRPARFYQIGRNVCILKNLIN